MSSKLPKPPRGDESQTFAVFVSTIVLLTVSCVFVGLRVLVRTVIVKEFWWDDWTIIFALLGTIIGAGLDFPQFDLGYGHHRYYISDPDYSRMTMYGYGEWIQTFATLMWTKVSICLFLYRIPITKVLRRPLVVAIVLLLVSNAILTLLWILQCLPIRAAWNESEQANARCFTKDQLLQIILAQGIISAISDFGLAAYPGLILLQLTMSLRKKLSLWLLMGLGVITGACCIVRILLNWSNTSPDSTWDSIPNWEWRCLEVNFGIAAACFPALYPGYKFIRRKMSPKRHLSPRSEDEKRGAAKRGARQLPGNAPGDESTSDGPSRRPSPPKPAAMLQANTREQHTLHTQDIQDYREVYPRDTGGDIRIEINQSLARIESEEQLSGLRLGYERV